MTRRMPPTAAAAPSKSTAEAINEIAPDSVLPSASMRE